MKQLSASSIAFVFLLISAVGCGPAPEIRFLNSSDQTFDELEVNFGENAEFTDLAPDALTEYRLFPGAYDYGYVRVVVGGDEYIIQPFDYVGETHLPTGRYTHTLQIEDDGNLTGTTAED